MSRLNIKVEEVCIRGVLDGETFFARLFSKHKKKSCLNVYVLMVN